MNIIIYIYDINILFKKNWFKNTETIGHYTQIYFSVKMNKLIYVLKKILIISWLKIQQSNEYKVDILPLTE